MLTHVADGLYTFETELALPFGLRLPTRCTVVRLRDDSLLLHSPVGIDDATYAAITALGDVRSIVAPNLLHHLFVAGAAARFPRARVFASERLRKKMKALPGADVLAPDARAQPFPGLESTFVAGVPGIDENVFFHEASGSLLCTDLLFNVTAPSTTMTRVFLSCVGCHRRFGQSRLWPLLTRDAPLAAARAGRILEWPFSRVVMGHGDVVDTDAHARTADALARMTGHARPRLAA